MNSDSKNPLQAFAEWTSGADGQWSALATERAGNAFTDIIAVMIPGARETVSKTVYALAKSWGEGHCSALGFEAGVSAPMAAMVNGTSAHAIDFDDNFDPAKAHATAVLAPALLALAEDRDIKGSALLDAYIVGLQIIGRVGQGVNPFHRNRGWHATATVGAVGSAAGCARLLGLGTSETAHAISLATSMCGGFMSQFGTMTKPLHAGFAAAGAVKAALFAEAGITAGDQTLHGSHGMGTLMVGQDVAALRASMIGKAEHGQTVTFATEDIGSPLMIEEYGLKVKRFPNCGSVHRALDGLLELREKHGFTADDVDEIFVRAPASHLRNLMYDRPVNSMQAKFSLEYGMAVGLLRGEAGLAEYAEDTIMDAKIQALLPITRKEFVEKMESEFPTEVHVRLKDGRTLSTSVKMPVGSTTAPLTHTQLIAKFDSCANSYLQPEASSSVKNMLANLDDNQSIRLLMTSLRAPESIKSAP
ncbi:MmgE/PrpD family protein [Pseudomonadota bacterium]